MSELIRLQKILAEAGFGSRRACEEFIVEGRVAVDGTVLRELGAKADPVTQVITLDGQTVAGPGKTSKLVKEQGQKVYYMLNKPKGVLCTNEDPAGRPLAIQLIPDRRRIFCVGRLDIDTEGLVILTNDGELTNLLTHPRYGVHKSYVAKVDGRIDGGQIMKLQNGVHLAEGKTQGALVRIRKRSAGSSMIEMEISEGMNRQIRRMLAAVNLNCRNLKRVRVGPLRLSGLPTGAARQLTRDEIDGLYYAAEKAKQNAEAGIPNKPFLPRKSRDEIKSFREEHYQEVDDRIDDDSDERKDYTERSESAKPLWKGKKSFGNPKNPNDKRRWKPKSEMESSELAAATGYGEKREWKPKGEFRAREDGGDRGGFGSKPAWKDKKSFGGEKREWKPKGEFRPREGGGDRGGFGGKPAWKDKKSFGEKREWKPKGEFRPRPESGGDRGGFGGKPAWKDKKSFGEKREWKPKGEFRPREGGEGGGGFGGKPAWKDKKSFGEKREWKPKGEFRPREGGEGGGFGGKPAWKDKKSFGEKREYKPRGEFNRRSGEDRPRKPRDAAYQDSRPKQDGIFRPAFQDKPEWKQRREERGQSTFRDKKDFQTKRQFRKSSDGFTQKSGSTYKSRDGNRGGQDRGYASKFQQKRPGQSKPEGDRQGAGGFKKFKPFNKREDAGGGDSGQ